MLKNHDGLIGTLLGYGRDNAWLYYRRGQGENIHLETAWETEILDQMVVQLSKKDWTLEDWDFTDLYFPSFVAIRDSEETKKLRDLYAESRQQFIEYYEGKNFLEATLSILAGAGKSQR